MSVRLNYAQIGQHIKLRNGSCHTIFSIQVHSEKRRGKFNSMELFNCYILNKPVNDVENLGIKYEQDGRRSLVIETPDDIVAISTLPFEEDKICENNPFNLSEEILHKNNWSSKDLSITYSDETKIKQNGLKVGKTRDVK